MKQFFSKYSYNMVIMFVNQFSMAIFGFVLVLASGAAKNVALRNATSVFSILFYLFLLYTMTWEIGFRDRVAIQSGREKNNPFRGALISLCANSVNFLLAILIALGMITKTEFFGTVSAACISISSLLEGMYTGLIVNSIGGVQLNFMWITYFLLPLPAVLTCGIAYQMGVHDLKCTSLFNQPYPESDREPKKKKKDD